MSLKNTSPLEIGQEAWPDALMKSSPESGFASNDRVVSDQGACVYEMMRLPYKTLCVSLPAFTVRPGGSQASW